MDWQEYLKQYWLKYPDEVSSDPTVEEIAAALTNPDINYVVSGRLFIIYTVGNQQCRVLGYWCDLAEIPSRELLESLKFHKAFIQSFSVPVYTIDTKDYFKRKYLVRYDEETKLWRYV